MILKIFSVYDSKVKAFNNPFFQRTTGEALRSFMDACQKMDGNFYKYAEDYTLFEIGAFDDATAKFELYETPQSLGLASQFKQS